MQNPEEILCNFFVSSMWQYLSTMARKIFGTSSEIAHSGKGLTSVFQEFSARISRAFILAWEMGAGLLFYGV